MKYYFLKAIARKSAIALITVIQSAASPTSNSNLSGAANVTQQNSALCENLRRRCTVSNQWSQSSASAMSQRMNLELRRLLFLLTMDFIFHSGAPDKRATQPYFSCFIAPFCTTTRLFFRRASPSGKDKMRRFIFPRYLCRTK